MITLSIIIPVYNGEKFLRKCLDSIFLFNTSSLDLFEVIIVNDGTPDRSLDVVSEYTRLYKNIKVFSQENKGLGEARNAGMKLVNGKYVWFVDQDDWITPNAIERICENLHLNKPDILSFEYRYPSGKRSTIKNNAVVDKTYKGTEFLKIHIVEYPVWQYVIKSSFIVEKNLHFQKENNEDALFTPIAFFLANSVKYDSSINYIYNYREDSIMTTMAPLEHCYESINVCAKLYEFMINPVNNFSEKRVFSKYISLLIGGIYFWWGHLNKKDKKLISKELPFDILFKTVLLNLQFKYIIGLLVMKFK